MKNYLTVPAGEYPCGHNLYLIVSDTGGRRWSFAYQRNGVKGKMGLGSAKDFTLKEAQDKAIDARRLLARKIDPKTHRADEVRKAKGKIKFGPFATAWADTYKKSLKHKSSRTKLDYLIGTHFLPLHDLWIDEITTDQIIKLVLLPLKSKIEVARDARQRLKLIFDSAIGDELRDSNPADYATRLRPKMGKAPKRGRVRGHHKAVHHNDVPALMQKLATLPTMSARALELTLLLVSRTCETQHMKWEHIDLDNAMWNLPAAVLAEIEQTEGGEGTKNQYDKITPLPRQAVAILRELAEGRVNDYVFPSRDLTTHMSNMAMLNTIKKISGNDTLTVHGLRGTFRTWAQEETSFEEEIVEHCMHHITGDDAEKAYKHGQAVKKRRIVLQTWADYVTKRPTPDHLKLVA